MNILSAIILGVVQGLTEFLPVSSSGHLVLAQSILPGFSQPGVLFDIVLHAGTLIAVIIYFWRKILSLSQKQIVLLIIGTLPAGLIGFLFDKQFEAMFGDVRAVGMQLIITGLICFAIDRTKATKKVITYLDSLIIGIAQAVAIIPGISRSGSTIFAATKRGVHRQEAAEFSFLLSIPAIGGAVVLQLLKHGTTDGIDVPFYAIGFVTALVFGLVSIKILLRMLVTKNFKVFGIYSVLIGVIAVLV